MLDIYAAPHLKRSHYTVPLNEEKRILKELSARQDSESKRLLRYLALPDLTRQPDSPIAELTQRIINLPDFKNFDLIQVPEIVSVKESFDLFDFPLDHPARSKSDTYYVNEDNVLRPHTTIMWYYHLKQPVVKKKIAAGQNVGALCFGKVYRKDEIDHRHMNVFHQMDGWLLAPKKEKEIGRQDLEEILIKIARSIFGSRIKYRFNPDNFPYTDPSLEMEIERDGQWVEVLGAGVVKGSVLKKLGVESTEYNGWAFGFGLERLAILSMRLPDIRLLWSEDPRVKHQLKLEQEYKEVSKYPPIIRDISFIVPDTFVANDYFDLIRDLGGNLVEEVALLDKYNNAAKFGAGKLSYTYRIVYRSIDRTLTNAEANALHEKLRARTEMEFSAKLR
ncbi:MAG: hypothetical protein HY481_00275 [Candidatus Vogelbacteria bacterium]|nr:hypothetical protein [Candidatus Vogelbacteria bacterium]